MNTILLICILRLVDGAETRQRILSPGQVLGISCQYSPSEFNVVAAGKEVSLHF